MKELEIYTTTDGKAPFIEWFTDLDLTIRARIDERLKRVKEGNFGDHRHLTGSPLSELKFKFGAGYRVYYKELDNVIVLILAGSDKSNQNKVIKQAEKYLAEYENRSN